MQAKSIITIIVSVAIVALGVAAMRLLPYGEARFGGRQILAQSESAYAEWDAVRRLMANPVYESPTGELSPFDERLPADQAAKIKHLQLGEPNPDALQRLSEAVKAMTKVLDEFPGADPSDRAIGLERRARLRALMGRYHQNEALMARARLSPHVEGLAEVEVIGTEEALVAASGAAKNVAALADVVAKHRRLAGASVQSAQQALATAKQQLQAVTDGIADRDAKIAGNETAISLLNGEIDRLGAQAQAKREAGRAAKTAVEAQALTEEARTLEAAIQEKHGQISDHRRQIELIAQGRADLVTQQSGANDRVKAATDALSARQGAIDGAAGKARQAKTNMDAGVKALTDRLTTLAAACRQADQAEQKAVELYGKALEDLVDAAEEAAKRGGKETAASLAQKAEMRMEIATIKIGRLQLRKRLDQLVQQVESAFSKVADGDQPSLADINSYVPDQRADRNQAAEDLTEAAKLLDRAVSMVPDDQKWIYQGQLAAAYFSLYRVTGKPADNQKAKQVRDAALAAKGDSAQSDPIRRMTASGTGTEE
ncbi:MAG: hypothetical protein ACYS8X_00485 [Planctomycetota bacterium]